MPLVEYAIDLFEHADRSGTSYLVHDAKRVQAEVVFHTAENCKREQDENRSQRRRDIEASTDCHSNRGNDKECRGRGKSDHASPGMMNRDRGDEAVRLRSEEATMERRTADWSDG